MADLHTYCLSHKNIKFLNTLNIKVIGTGNYSKKNDYYPENWLKDNTGKNISFKNRNFGSLTSHYWLWHNMLDKHKVDDGIAVCHYRRVWLKKDVGPTLEANELKNNLPNREEQLAVLLLPNDAAEDAGAIVEVRAGTGGGEAGLFALDLLKMYELYAKKKGWRVEILSKSATESGGVREASASFVSDANSNEQSAYSVLQYESGVHRVQRVPVTEMQGRVHTSTASVAVLPHVDDLDTSDLVKEEDVRIDTMRASGAGGQHVNTTNSAVRLTHIPTNTVVICQDERSQHKNKDKAFKVLRARVVDAKRLEVHESRADTRRGLIGSGDRSERVRTYNFKDGRVKDHRVNHLINDLDGFLSGGDSLQEMFEVLANEDRRRKLEEFKE